MIEKTIQNQIYYNYESFSNKNIKTKAKKSGLSRCDSYFVDVAQNLGYPFKNSDCKSKTNAKSTKNKVKNNKSVFCKNLIKSGWNPNWTKSELQKRRNEKEIIDVKNKIRNNLGLVSEAQIKNCFPNYDS